MKNNTQAVVFEAIQAILDESFVDAEDRLQTLFSINVKEQLDELRESIASELYKKVITESLPKDADASDWIEDFVHSKNPKFEGKSKDERKQMALAAYYENQKK